MARTHIAMGVAVGSLGSLIFMQDDALAWWVGVLMGSIIPDIDHPQSKIGRRFPGISHLLHAIFGHRGGTHSVMFILLISLAGWIVSVPLGIGLSLGVLTHILADMVSFSKGQMFTRGGGCPLLWPFKDKRFGFIERPYR